MIRRLVLLVAILTIVGSLVFSGFNTLKKSSSQIVDVSWPNCRLKNQTYYTYGIVGATGGLDFHPNKCLSLETSWFTSYSLYMNTGYPGRTRGLRYADSPNKCAAFDNFCLAYNYGYNAARYAITYAARSNAHATTWWLDVESENSWTDSPFINRQVLAGAEAAIYTLMPLVEVGVYSYPGQWEQLTGGWQIGVPAWVATGGLKKSDGVSACRQKSFSGGPVWLGQYTDQLDINLPCSNQYFIHLFDPLSG